MYIRHKLLYGGLLLTVVPIVVAVLVTGFIAGSLMEDLSRQEGKQQLTALRELQYKQIHSYFNILGSQATTLAANPTVVEAMEGFSSAFLAATTEMPIADEQVDQSLQSYYQTQFGRQYAAQNSGAEPPIETMLAPIDRVGRLLQYHYIAHNPRPIGEKDDLLTLENSSRYNQLHQRYHPVLQQFQHTFGFYDLFLVDSTSGHVVYSVFKELDYATSLLNGPYAQSSLAEVFQKALALKERNGVVLTDFTPYLPSYHNPASFLATPIWQGEQKIGVLIFQLPIDKINQMMTMEGEWSKGGYGQTGETYLVGADHLMRSQSRFLVENRSDYLATLRANGVAEKVVRKIESSGLANGLQPAQSEAIDRALAGESGFIAIRDYRQIEVFSAYRPFEIYGLRWVLVSEKDQSEVLAGVAELERQLTSVATVIVVVIALIAAVILVAGSRSITQPLLRVVAQLQNISQGDGDLTVRVPVTAQDELGELATAFNLFISQIELLVQQIKAASLNIQQAMADIASGNEDLAKRTEQQASSLEETAASMEEITSMVHKSAESSAQITEHSNSTRSLAQSGSAIIQDAVEAMHAINSSSHRITDIVTVMDEIAFQTNLLALNASVEAARAGEHGRGFAVVASEVRNLAQRSADSAKAIKKLIEESRNQITQGVALVSRTGSTFSEIQTAIEQLALLVVDIAAASREQASGIAQINSSVMQLDDTTQQNAALVEQSSSASAEVASQTIGLTDLVKRFKTGSGS